MDDDGEVKIPEWHVAELAGFFAAHDRWLFGHACVRTRGDRELAADLVQDTFEAAARAWDTLRGHPGRRQRAWLLSTLAHKDVSGFRRREAFQRRQADIHARYQPTAADTTPPTGTGSARTRPGGSARRSPGRSPATRSPARLRLPAPGAPTCSPRRSSGCSRCSAGSPAPRSLPRNSTWSARNPGQARVRLAH